MKSICNYVRKNKVSTVVYHFPPALFGRKPERGNLLLDMQVREYSVAGEGKDIERTNPPKELLDAAEGFLYSRGGVAVRIPLYAIEGGVTFHSVGLSLFHGG